MALLALLTVSGADDEDVVLRDLYLIEKSLSVDNVFVWAVIFSANELI